MIDSRMILTEEKINRIKHHWRLAKNTSGLLGKGQGQTWEDKLLAEFERGKEAGLRTAMSILEIEENS
jgi:hypothetical protein